MALNNSPSLVELPTNLSHDHEWVINISRSLEETLLENNNDDELTLATIFNVPNSLRSSKPVSYTPQVVSIGPYHHRRLEVVEMEQHKLAAARWVQKVLKNKHNKPMGFHELVARVAEHDIRIRSCYHRYLDFDREKLAWMFTIDVSFLYQYLRTCPSKTKLPSLENMGYLMEWARKKIWHNAVLRDIIMMENQVPLFLLKEIHGFLCEEEDDNNSDKLLASMLMGLCKHLAPIKHLNDKCFEVECFTRSHLLELLYYTVAPNWTTFPIEANSKNQENNNDNHNHNNNNNEKQVDEKKMYGCMGLIFNFLWCVTCAPVHILVKISKSKIILGLINVPVKIVAYFLELRDKSGAVKNFVSSMHDVVEEAEKSSEHAEGSDESPLVEELAIPSVEELSKTGVVFRPTKGGINAVRFDKSSATLHLPVIHVTDSTDVVLRNLVAYEACIAPEGMILARYTELMNGIIDTEEDVKILRESGVLLNHLKSDKEVASLWNGMTTSVKVTKVPIVDKVIEDVNAYYSASWKVKVKHSMKKYVYASWPCLTFLAANILLFLSVVETVCTMYGCSKLVRVQ